MKTIVRNTTNISLYYFADDKDVTIESDKTTIGDSSNPDFLIGDCTSSNVTLHTGIDEKADWWGHKYKHNGSSWSTNTDFKGEFYLAADINDSVTTINVENSNPFTTSGTVKIEAEEITYTGVDGTNLTGCTRGANSTSATSHRQDLSVVQI